MESEFPVEMHIYMVSPSQLQSITKFCGAVSEELRWQEKQDWWTDWLRDRSKTLYPPQLIAWGIKITWLIIPSATCCMGYKNNMTCICILLLWIALMIRTTAKSGFYLQFCLATGFQSSFPSILAWSTKILYVRATADSIKNRILQCQTHLFMKLSMCST